MRSGRPAVKPLKTLIVLRRVPSGKLSPKGG